MPSSQCEPVTPDGSTLGEGGWGRGLGGGGGGGGG